MKITDIKIPKSFLKTPPRERKIVSAAEYYNQYGQLKKPIVITANNYLVDGYARYLAAQRLGLTDVPVDVKGRLYISGVHKKGGKEYWWTIDSKSKNDLVNHIELGSRIIVDTKKGEEVAYVTGMTYRKPSITGNLRSVLDWR